MTKHRVEWIGGPCDGLVDRLASPMSYWFGPDPAEPKEKVVIYRLEKRPDDRLVYEFDKALTEQRNAENDKPL